MEAYQHRLIVLNDISDDACRRFTKKLRCLELESDDPIELYINCYGGTVRHALAMHDLIKSSNCDILGIVAGACYSATNVVLQACYNRFSLPNSMFMLHGGTASTGNVPVGEFRESYKGEALEVKQFDDIVFADPRYRNTLRRYSKSGKYFTAQEAYDLGLLDRIIVKRVVK